MARMLPDPTFYPSPTLAGEAPAEKLAYVALLTPGENGKRDALGVVDTDPTSADYGRLVARVDFPNGGNELHHFGWNACSAALCPYAPHPHVERRYLVIPGLRSSRVHVVDTKEDPRTPKLVKVVEPHEIATRAAASEATLLLSGESGTGKELIARALHQQSHRAQKPFVAVNCGLDEADALPAMKVRAAERKFPFPYLHDPSQQSGRDYGARVTPEAFVLRPDRTIVYLGAVDDRETTKVNDDRLPAFSSWGPTANGDAKPDAVAPGARIGPPLHRPTIGAVKLARVLM